MFPSLDVARDVSKRSEVGGILRSERNVFDFMLCYLVLKHLNSITHCLHHFALIATNLRFKVNELYSSVVNRECDAGDFLHRVGRFLHL